MRHNDARKWLHAVLDLLPVLLIPVFMIYSHRHDITHQTTVDIQYKYQSNEVNSLDDLVAGNIYLFDVSFDAYNLDYYGDPLSLKLYAGYLEYDTNYEVSFASHFTSFDNPYYITIDSSQCTLNGVDVNYLYIENCVISFDDLYNFLDYFNENWQSDLRNISYTDYNVIESVDVHDETSSVMNVFMDDFNVAIDKYFNMGNVFNLTGVYQWFNTNIFGGNAPTIIFSVWNIVLYEFVMDLIFLLYALFMWFIDMCKHLMEKPFRSIK